MALLVYQTAFIGDLILTTPLLRALRDKLPGEKIDLACRKGGGDLFLKLGLVDEVIEVDKSQPESVRDFERKIKSKTYDTVICAHESFRTHLLMWSIKARLKIGYSNFWNFLVFNQRVKRLSDWPEAIRLLLLLAPVASEFKMQIEEILLQDQFKNSRSRTEVRPWPREIPAFTSLHMRAKARAIEMYANAILLAPGSVWNTKKWGDEKYLQLALSLIKKDFKVVLIGTSNEKPICDEIENLVLKQFPDKKESIVNRAGQTSLFELFEIMASSSLLIANDSAPIHLAALAGLKTISIFGPTTLDLGYRPWSAEASVVQVDLPCRPCGKHGHQKCPIQTHDCMKKIKVEDVQKIIFETL